jgi:hypothetical protein
VTHRFLDLGHLVIDVTWLSTWITWLLAFGGSAIQHRSASSRDAFGKALAF